MQHMKRWGAIAALLLSALAAALAPMFARTSDTAAAKDFPGWPTHYEGRALTELPLTQRELAFVHDFPGRVGRFSDGRREIIIRRLGAPTRRLHPGPTACVAAATPSRRCPAGPTPPAPRWAASAPAMALSA